MELHHQHNSTGTGGTVDVVPHMFHLTIMFSPNLRTCPMLVQSYFFNRNGENQNILIPIPSALFIPGQQSIKSPLILCSNTVLLHHGITQIRWRLPQHSIQNTNRKGKETPLLQMGSQSQYIPQW